MSKLVLVHLSDIHFTKPGARGGSAVVNEDIRDKLVKDLGTMRALVGDAHHVLISGDIAYSGQTDEYIAASNWIRSVCKAVCCDDREGPKVICGNHDVQRSAIDASQSVKDFQTVLSSKRNTELNDYLHNVCADPVGLPFIPFQNYNLFAEQFLGHFSVKRPYWDHTVILNDKSHLIIRGINSAWASNKNDDDEHPSMVVGFGNVVLNPKQEGTEYLVMCHHPPASLRDRSDVEKYLNTRARLQLFGHLHAPNVDSKTEGTLKLYAGAINPEDPVHAQTAAYNWITLEVKKAGSKRILEIEIFPRKWNGDKTVWDADYTLLEGQSRLTFGLALGEFIAQEATLESLVTAEVAVPLISDPLNVVTQQDHSFKKVADQRRLALRFLHLPFNVQVDVGNKLELLQAEDHNLSSSELFTRLFTRAEHKGFQARFWQIVKEQSGVGSDEPNPFLT